ncbi:MAG: hypothetical protein JSU70_20930 [Phycisphaerales bacterium]|nr:MAG: hypothetical protein JSU70_20930 [Phycisphaerales bacterium]
METNILCIPVLLPLVVGFGLLFLPNKLKLRSGALTLIISFVTFVLSIRIFALGRAEYSWAVLQISDFNLELLLRTTPLGAFILVFAMGFGVLISLYSLESMAGARRTNEYYGAVLLTIGGSAGILLSNHLLFLLIFWEIVTASLYVLITTGGRNSNFAATKSFAMIGASDAAFLLGVMMAWGLSGTFVITDIGLATTSTLPVVAFLLLMMAAITKAGALPLHTWLPTSGEHAPASVMALLPAAIDKLLGIYLLLLIVRDIFVLQSAALSTVLAIIGAATIVVAVMIAMVQHNLKKLLSFHAVSQVGYMILGIATMTPVGIAGGLFHLLNNAIYKCCLFLCSGAVEQQTGTADLERLGGLGKKMPITFATCLIAALSISGIPPLNGFVSKWMVYQGVIQMGAAQTGSTAALWPVWLTCAMFGSALTLASFVKIIHSMFLSRLPSDLKDVKEVSSFQTVPMMVLAAVCVLLGVFYHVALDRLIYPALGVGAGADVLTGTWQSTLATALIVIGVAVGLLILLIASFAKKTRIVPTWNCGEQMSNEQMIVPGTHFYKTVSNMGGLRQLYSGQEKGYFDLYDQGGRFGLFLTRFLRWMHSGLLPMYLTWVVVGLLIVLFVVCGIW